MVEDLDFSQFEYELDSIDEQFLTLEMIVNDIIADGIITQDEMDDLSRMDHDVYYEYCVAQFILSQIDPNSPLYLRAKQVLDYLRHCHDIVREAMKRTGLQEIKEKEAIKRKRRAWQKAPPEKKLNIQVTPEGRDLIKSLGIINPSFDQTPAEAKEVVSTLPQDVSKYYQNLVLKTLRGMNRFHLDIRHAAHAYQISRWLGLERQREA